MSARELCKNSNVFLDSGAFTAATQGTIIDIDAYAEFIQEHKDLFTVYANLDVIGDAEKSWKNQQFLESKGLFPLPTVHFGGGNEKKWIDRYIDSGHDYLALGGVASSPMGTRQVIRWLDQVWGKALCGEDRMPKVRVHAFGITSVPILVRYPWYSADSATCVKIAAYGKIYLPDWDGNYLNCYPVGISDQTNLEVVGAHRRAPSIYAQPPMIKARNLQLIHDMGFKLSNVEGRVLQPRRSRKGESRISKFTMSLISTKEVKEMETEEKTLTNSHEQRFGFNTLIWDKVAQQIRPWKRTFPCVRSELDPTSKEEGFHLYQVASTKSHITTLKKAHTTPSFLISYLTFVKKKRDTV